MRSLPHPGQELALTLNRDLLHCAQVIVSVLREGHRVRKSFMKQGLRRPQLGPQTVKSDPNTISTPSQKVRNNPSTRNPAPRSGLNRCRECRLPLGGSLLSGRLAFCRCLDTSRLGIPKPVPIKTAKPTTHQPASSPARRAASAQGRGSPAPAISNKPTFRTRVLNIWP